MSSVNLITSFSAAGWEAYGQRCVETFNTFWPPEVTLHVVSENALGSRLPRSIRIVFHDLYKSAAAKSFLNNNANTLWTQGRGDSARPATVAPRWRGGGYNFRFDAYKFSKKVFAIELVTGELQSGRVAWLDADVVTFAPVPLDLMGRMLPDAYAISCLARKGYHSECGFVGYNLDSADTHNFIKAFAALYSTEEVFNLPEWHDSWVFDWLRGKLLTKTYQIPHRSKGHPFINSELGRYMDHLKGKRKDRGRSASAEQIANSTIEYWRP